MTTRTNPFDITGRVAIVTGASAGLGRRFVEVLHAHGATVIAGARRAGLLDELADQLPGVIGVPCDITEADGRRILFDTARERGGRVDIVVNNAGVSGPSTPAETYPRDRWDATLRLNLSALFEMSVAAATVMLDRGSGTIVNVASAFGHVANHPVMDVAYAASKGAVVNLTRELAAEWAPRGVRVNALAPGWFHSEMTAGMDDDERSLAYVARGCPVGRMGEPRELDGALLFLCSDASSYCIGQSLVVDGGWTIR